MTVTPDGAASVHLERRRASVVASAWGPGADWALGHLPGLIGLGDAYEDFDPEHPVVRTLHRSRPGLRFTRTDRLWEAALPGGARSEGAGAGRDEVVAGHRRRFR